MEKYLLKQQSHVFVENVISGPGLEKIYCFLCDRTGVNAELRSAAEIGAEALSGAGLPRQAALLLLNALASLIVKYIHYGLLAGGGYNWRCCSKIIWTY